MSLTWNFQRIGRMFRKPTPVEPESTKETGYIGQEPVLLRLLVKAFPQMAKFDMVGLQPLGGTNKDIQAHRDYLIKVETEYNQTYTNLCLLLKEAEAKWEAQKVKNG